MSGAASRSPEALARAASRPGKLQSLLLALWMRVRIDWTFASRGLNDALRAERGLRSAERRFVSDVLFGMVRNLRRLDEALRAGGVRGGASAPDALRLLAYLLLEAGLSLDVEDSGVAGAERVDWSRVAGIDEELRQQPLARRIARLYSLPDWLTRELVRQHGDRAESLAAAFNLRAPTTVRANRLVTSAADLAAALAAEGVESRPGAYSPTALVIDGHVNVRALRAFASGAVEIQDEGSQLIADLVTADLGDRALVADVCAGAGGKTLAIAAAMANRGRILAADVDATKLEELRRRARRAGVNNVHAVRLRADGGFPEAVDEAGGKADRVLVDAPCSGIGALRRNPAQRWRLTPSDLKSLPKLQLEITSRAADLLAPGGLLVYATCTVLDAENRKVVDRLMAARPELQAVSIEALLGADRARLIADDSGRFLEVFPDSHGTDGFFAAAFRRTTC